MFNTKDKDRIIKGLNMLWSSQNLTDPKHASKGEMRSLQKEREEILTLIELMETINKREG